MTPALLSQPTPDEHQFPCTDATERTRMVLLTRSRDHLVLLCPPPGTAELGIAAAEELRDAIDLMVAEIRSDNRARLRGVGIGGHR